MIGVGSRTAGNHADKVAGGNGVGGGAAQAFACIFTFNPALGKRQAAGPHGAVFTADALDADVTGFHLTARSKTVSIPSSWARAIISWVAQSSMHAIADRPVSGFCLGCFCFFFFCH